MFNEGRINVHNKEGSRIPSLITKDLEYRTDQHIRTNRHFTLDEIHEKFPQISRSLIHEIVKKHLHYKKFVQDGYHKCSLKSTDASIQVLF
jgi:hypothetical protein